jgi:hypothetical protein
MTLERKTTRTGSVRGIKAGGDAPGGASAFLFKNATDLIRTLAGFREVALLGEDGRRLMGIGSESAGGGRRISRKSS